VVLVVGLELVIIVTVGCVGAHISLISRAAAPEINPGKRAMEAGQPYRGQLGV